jgi:hypothetical protein
MIDTLDIYEDIFLNQIDLAPFNSVVTQNTVPLKFPINTVAAYCIVLFRYSETSPRKPPTVPP